MKWILSAAVVWSTDGVVRTTERLVFNSMVLELRIETTTQGIR